MVTASGFIRETHRKWKLMTMWRGRGRGRGGVDGRENPQKGEESEPQR